MIEEDHGELIYNLLQYIHEYACSDNETLLQDFLKNSEIDVCTL